MATRKWSDDTMMKFVRLYEVEPVLWDSMHEEYKNKSARANALARIVKSMHLDDFGTSECKMKIKNMRSHYWQEINKIRNSILCGGSVYKPTVVWFEAVDRFLRRLLTLDIANDLVLKDSCAAEIIDLDKVKIKEEPESSGEDSVSIFPDDPLRVENTDDEGEDIRESSPKRLKTSSRSSRRSASAIREELNEIQSTLPHFTNHDLDKIQKFFPDIRNKRNISEKNLEEPSRQKPGRSPRARNLEASSTGVSKSVAPAVCDVASTTQEDPFDIFGKSVSAQLKALPKRKAIETQLKIQSILTEQLLTCEYA